MTDVFIHGILAQEYQQHFKFNLKSSTDVLKAIDCNREGFLARVAQLQREGFYYDILINKKRIKSADEFKSLKNSTRIDLVPAIVGQGFLGTAISAIFGAITTSAVMTNIAISVGLAAIAYLLTPKPDLGLPPQQELSAEAQAQKQSYIFSSTINLARQGTFLPLGYGRLKVGSAVVQASIKSFPLIKPDSQVFNANNFADQSAEGSLDSTITANSLVS